MQKGEFMREKYESLALTELRALAKIRGIKGSSSLKKAELVDAMVMKDEEDKRQKEQEMPAKTSTVADHAEDSNENRDRSY